MPKQFAYQSVLAPYIRDFIHLKEATGCNFLRGKWILHEIDQFFLRNNMTEPVINRDLVLAWHKTRVNDSPSTMYSKYSILAQLARYMSRQGCNCFIPRLPESKHSKSNFTPYIFTHNQIEELLQSSDMLRMYDRHMSNALFCVPAVLRLLYSTGLRVSEALSIKNADLNLEKGYILIRKTKNGSERMVPIHNSLHVVLQQYISYRNKMPVRNVGSPNSFFFIKSDGTYCNAQSVYRCFRKLLADCGIPYVGNHHGPRVHDLRHTFAVHSMVQMAHNNQDLYSTLPVISTCLGHKSLFATEQYVRLTGEMYPELSNQCSSINAFVYPKI
ncbi:tyrosine-type recombinase/integrase [Lentimicrobium sp.]|uniref:tyrosine-type recombinase/integrase n=1 Tax=Lentimicrobium sp. TaxID=2034841 RepID=UPI002BFD3ECC|nr:tyrosine-type recombinase/integrase [Lentimicrobium sp.]HRW70663.1 tyrosine-type recombinase/integrase [Lentimicrobium sp.]